jgi:hypothetical protein
MGHPTVTLRFVTRALRFGGGSMALPLSNAGVFSDCSNARYPRIMGNNSFEVVSDSMPHKG